jgi:hypothetical protein
VAACDEPCDHDAGTDEKHKDEASRKGLEDSGRATTASAPDDDRWGFGR